MPRIPKTPRRRFTDAQIMAAVESSRGLVYLAAKNLNCDPATIHHRAQRNPKIREAIENERGLIVDFAESKLVNSVNNGEAWAVCFLLKTQGRKRGYTERTEIISESRVNVVQNLEKLSDEQLTAIAIGRSENITAPEQS